MVEILVSFWDGLVSGAMLVSGRVEIWSHNHSLKPNPIYICCGFDFGCAGWWTGSVFIRRPVACVENLAVVPESGCWSTWGILFPSYAIATIFLWTGKYLKAVSCTSCYCQICWVWKFLVKKQQNIRQATTALRANCSQPMAVDLGQAGHNEYFLHADSSRGP